LKQYTLNDLDDSGTLRPGGLLVTVMFFLCRQLLYGPITLVATRKSRASSGAEIDMSFLTIHSGWEYAACIPAVIVIYLLFQRKKEAGPTIRKLWSHGHKFLLASTIAQLILIILPALNNISEMPVSILLFAVVHAYIIYYLLTSLRVKDVFGSFPK
jgi:hypothetical protein